MSDFVIFTDSTSDLPREYRESWGVEYVPMNYVVDDVEYPASLDWEAHSPKEFYDIMRGGKRIYTTQVARQTFLDAFEPLLAEGKDALYIGCSSGLSGSVTTAAVLAQELADKYEAKLYCVDALNSSLAQGHMVRLASEKREAGLSAAETAAYIDSIKLRVNEFATVGSLEYLRRAGRVKASKAFFGNLFGVKPLLLSDVKGHNFAFKKAKGAANARIAIAECIVDAAEGNYETLYLSHADCQQDIDLLREEILKRAPFKEVITGIIGPIVGASVGPGTIMAICYGKEVTIEGDE